MAVTSPPAITALPAAPDRADRATFSSRATAMFTALKDVFIGQISAVATNVAANATDAAANATAASGSASAASTSASNAATSAAAAGTAAGAPVWASGTFAFGDARWSPLNRLVYRYITVGGGAGATDPSLDATNWALLGTLGLTVIDVTTTTVTAVKGNHYVLKNVALSTVTLPAAAASGDTIWITVANSLTTNIVSRNGLTIESLAQDMTIDKVTTVRLCYLNSTWRNV